MDDFEILDCTNFNIKKPYKLNYPNNDNNYISVDFYQSTADYKNHNFIEDESLERIIQIDYKKYHKDVEDAYKSFDEIKNQFILDCKRGKFYCNGNKIEDPEEVYYFLKDKIPFLQLKTLIMFCTQTSLGYPFEIIRNDLSTNFNYHLSELNSAEKITYPAEYKINFDIDRDNINLKIEKTLRIFKLKDGLDKTISIINILLDFNLKNEFLTLKINYQPIKEKEIEINFDLYDDDLYFFY